MPDREPEPGPTPEIEAAMAAARAARRAPAGGPASPHGAGGGDGPDVDDLGIPDDDEIAALERAHQVLRSTLDGVERRT